MKALLMFAVALCSVFMFSSFSAHAGRYEVRKEIIEGHREVNREKREAAIEVLRCKTRRCAQREIREGYREVAREKREARREIRQAMRKGRYDKWRHGNNIIGGIVVSNHIVGVAGAIAKAND